MPPHTKKHVELVVTWTKMAEDFEIPITIDGIQGYTGAKFPRRVQGHYYWFLPLGRPFQSKLTGTGSTAFDARGSVKVSDLKY